MTVYQVPSSPRDYLLQCFYESLMILDAMGSNQGDYKSRDGIERKPLGDTSNNELRRLYLEAISYACDFQKGGRSTTAVLVTSSPLTYHVVCSKSPPERVEQFLVEILGGLEAFYTTHDSIKHHAESIIFNSCVAFSISRLTKYHKFLRARLKQCIEQSDEDGMTNRLLAISAAITEAGINITRFCLECDGWMKARVLDFIGDKLATSDIDGDLRCNLSELRHYIGRLAYHVRMVKIMVAAATRLPYLFERPRISFVPTPQTIPLPTISQKVDLKAMAHSMIFKGQIAELAAIQDYLVELNQKFETDKPMRKKPFDPCIHAELKLLEYVRANRDHLCPVDGDYYIGCSKPACYCCEMYIRNHPWWSARPATHGNLYINWMPPTNIHDVRDPRSALAQCERFILPAMIREIEAQTLECIKSLSRRPRKCDSITRETFTNDDTMSVVSSEYYASPNHIECFTPGFSGDYSNPSMRHLTRRLDNALSITEADEWEDDSDDAEELRYYYNPDEGSLMWE